MNSARALIIDLCRWQRGWEHHYRFLGISPQTKDGVALARTMTMERKLTLNLDQVRRFETACAKSGLELRHVMWMLTGRNNMRSVKSLADGKVDPCTNAEQPSSTGTFEWETIKVGKGKDLAIAMQIAHEGKISGQSTLRCRSRFLAIHSGVDQEGKVSDTADRHRHSQVPVCAREDGDEGIRPHRSDRILISAG